MSDPTATPPRTGPAPRVGTAERTTGETSVRVHVDLDGDPGADVRTGVAFFDHMLDQLGRHGRMALQVHADGDTHVDAHHTVEDTGIALGVALADAFGDKAGIERFGDALVPIDETLVRVAVDLSGRPHLSFAAPRAVPIGDYEASLTRHVLESVVANARITLHVAVLADGDNAHHQHEAVFKGVAVALRRALTRTAPGTAGTGAVPSTKGVL